MSSRTPLHAEHEALGAKLVDFAGYAMPITYRTSISEEHVAVRQRAGLFDLSHMGRVRFKGPQRDLIADKVLSFDVAKLKVGRTRYALVCNDEGGVEDDVLVSREEDALLLVVNASNRMADLKTFRAVAEGLDAEVVDDSEAEAMIAVQGPKAAQILEKAGLPEALTLKYYTHKVVGSPFGPVLASRTGYTGEDGYELTLPAEQAVPLWQHLLKVGPEFGMIPCGLGARDSLRLEAGMPLHGHEISPTIDPLSAGLDFAVRSNKGYRGQAALERIQKEGPSRKLIGLFVEGRRIPRAGYPVTLDGTVVGDIKSGTLSPTLGKNIATALVTAEAATSDALMVDIRGKAAAATRTELPFYTRSKE